MLLKKDGGNMEGTISKGIIQYVKGEGSNENCRKKRCYEEIMNSSTLYTNLFISLRLGKKTKTIRGTYAHNAI